MKKNKSNENYYLERVSESLIIKWKSNLMAESKIIKEIEKIRDGLYAHTDPNHESVIENSTITQEDIGKIIEVVKNIMQEIQAILLDRDTTEIYKPAYSKKSVQNIIQHYVNQRELILKEKMETFIKKNE